MSDPSDSHKRRALVTGAAGFLGRHVVSALLAEGWEVRALLHQRTMPPDMQSGSLQVVRADINDASALRAALVGVDAVCHLAAYIPPNHEDPQYAEQCLRTNALATLLLATSACEKPGCCFIYASAGNAYADGRDPATEDEAVYPADRATYYLASKLAGELYIEHLRRAHQLRALTLRISSPYGCGMAARSVVAQFMDRARRGQPLEVRDSGEPRCDFVSVSDVVKAFVAALKSPRPGIYNVGSGTAHSVLELAHAVADTFPEQRSPVEVLPARGAVPASFRPLCIHKASAAWGYRPVSLREGLEEFRRSMERETGDHCHTE